MRGGRFESNLLTLQGRPKHTSRGYSQSHTCNISPFFPGCGSGSPSSTTEYDDSVPACARMRKRCSKMVKVKSTCRSNQVLKLTDYHILGMCLVRQTLNRHYHTLRPYQLSLHRRGITRTTTPPVDLTVVACSKHSTPIFLASDRKSLDFYRTMSIAN